MRAKFEEKTYENYFNAELDTKTDIFFPLGQVQEGYLGFDSSAYSRSRRLWRNVGYPFWFYPHFGGVDLREIADEMEHHLGIAIDDMPRMKANLLFQYKRPQYITLSSGSEWGHWNQPYFRYDIYQEQQDLLMQIHQQFTDRLLILYASPTAHDINVLVGKKKNNEIISSSNFTECHKLDGHHRNTYVEAGLHSIACSDPENIEKLDLLGRLEQFSNNDNKEQRNRDFIINFRKRLISIVAENAYYGQSLKILEENLPKVYNYELLYSFLVMQNFKNLTGVQWLVKI
ncbi:hypothetical protein BDD43_0169 [Mucilaginibacter gracilis]|uniref:Uncharacterized protein n=1 Tax=Mucilaginibacter gracilis TaxID=423350 RepID=A0A495ITG8_9SPHI|nr:hypothetical protein [Mucilaginibacter gracilis]RKR80076.1 hypothetical protein BDD43_0169 [Mucilaginibacter gracilis]